MKPDLFAALKQHVESEGYKLDVRPDSSIVIPVVNEWGSTTRLYVPIVLIETEPGVRDLYKALTERLERHKKTLEYLEGIKGIDTRMSQAFWLAKIEEINFALSFASMETRAEREQTVPYYFGESVTQTVPATDYKPVDLLTDIPTADK
jgi:hypothetical protein